MKLSILALFVAAAASSPALAQGSGDAGGGNASSRANYDYSYRFPGDPPQTGYEATQSQAEPLARAPRSQRLRH